MRLIDADALLSELNNLEVNCKNKYVKQGIDDGLHYYMPRILENEPTIDAVPVVHGRWVICSDGYYPYCSECKEEPYRKSNADLPKYCPSCGARMDMDGE